MGEVSGLTPDLPASLTAKRSSERVEYVSFHPTRVWHLAKSTWLERTMIRMAYKLGSEPLKTPGSGLGQRIEKTLNTRSQLFFPDHCDSELPYIKWTRLYKVSARVCLGNGGRWNNGSGSRQRGIRGSRRPVPAVTREIRGQFAEAETRVKAEEVQIS